MMTRVDEELNYYAKVLEKIQNKKYELYVVSRIIHLVDDREIEFTAQQHVRTENGRYLIDLYFPQLKLAIEVDESHHKRQVIKDKLREQAVISESEIEKFLRVDVNGKSIDEVNTKIGSIVEEIQKRRKSLESKSKFRPFLYGQKYDIEHWLKQGSISVTDDARFRTHADVAVLFGRNYKSYQKATIKLDDRNYVWFPKLYGNSKWDNQISADGKKIVQKSKQEGKGKKKKVWERDMIVFAHYRDPLGKVYYTFKGVFRTDPPQKKATSFELVSDGIAFDGKGGFKPRRRP